MYVITAFDLEVCEVKMLKLEKLRETVEAWKETDRTTGL